jgi:hypothetical protein
MNTKKYITSVDRDQADIEIEDGEFVINKYGITEAKGRKHSNNVLTPGGIPYKIDDGETFIVSDKLKVKDPEIAEMFNTKMKKGGVTYADMMRGAKLDTYKDIAMLMDPFSTDLEKNTAILNLNNKNKKANIIVALQELQKGGVPTDAASETLQSMNITPEELVPLESEQLPVEPPMQMQEAPQEAIPPLEEPVMEAPEQPAGRYGLNIKKYGYGGTVDDFELFNKIKGALNLPESDRNKTNSQLLGDYGEQLIGIYNHFKDNPEELDKLYDIWSKNSTVGQRKFTENISKDKFLDQYILWLYSKQAFKTTGEGGQDWSGKQSGSKSQSGQELNKRNAKDSGYQEAFADFAGINRNGMKDNITLYQTMDQAINDYAKGFNSDDISISTNDYLPEDASSNAGYASSTGQAGRQGVSIADGFYGQRTSDFLPYIVKKQKKEKEGKTEPKVYDHYTETEDPYDPRFFQQDLNNLAFAVRNRMNIRKPHYRLSDVRLSGVDPHYVDYRQQAYQAASDADMLASASGMTANPQARAAMYYALADETNKAVANALTQEQNTNMQTANQFELANSEIANKEAVANADIYKKYFDETEIGRQQYQNAINKANEQIVKTWNQGLTNRQMRELLRKQNYTMTPDGRVVFTGEKQKLAPKAMADQFKTMYTTLVEDYHFDPKDVSKELINYYIKQKTGQSNRLNLEDLARYMSI